MAINAVRQCGAQNPPAGATPVTPLGFGRISSLAALSILCSALVACGSDSGSSTDGAAASTSQTSAGAAPTSSTTASSGSTNSSSADAVEMAAGGLVTRGSAVKLTGLSAVGGSTTSSSTGTGTTSSSSTSSSSGATQSTPTTTSSPSVSSGNGARPFSANSPWNAPIASNASYSSASDARTITFRNASTKLRANTRRWTMWVYQASNSDPLVSINVSVRNLDSMSGTANPNAGTVQIRLPAAAHPDPATYTGDDLWGDSDSRDAHMTILDPDGKHAHEFWHVEKTNGSGAIKAVSYARVPIDGDGVNICGPGTAALTGSYCNPAMTTYGWGATRAYGGSNLGGLIRAGEVTSGPIGHAIAIALPASMMGGARVWPATSDDMSPSYTGNIPMGTRFAIPRSVNLQSLGLSAAHLRLAQALQDYGAIVVDKSGSTCMYSEGSSAQADGDALNANPAQLDLLHSLMVAVQ